MVIRQKTLYLTPPEGVPLVIMAVGLEKTNDALTDRQNKFDDMLNHLRDSQTDRQTDGRICHNSIALCMYCILVRDNNVETATLP